MGEMSAGAMLLVVLVSIAGCIVVWALFGSLFVRMFMWAEVESLVYGGMNRKDAEWKINHHYDFNWFWSLALLWPMVAFLLMIFIINTINNIYWT